MRVLVAEDDARTREGLQTILEGEGYDVVCARDGGQALEMFGNATFDYVLLDIMMPRLNGYDVCRAIRKANAAVPVVFISAKSEEIDKVLGLELGADDFISKPFGVREVVARMRAITRRSMRGRVYEDGLRDFGFGPYTVSPTELQAVDGTAVLELSLREVRLLKALASSVGVVLGRGRLYRECWGEEPPLESRTLDQHIAKLRKKIEVDAKSPKLIQTVHGLGYRYCG